MTDIVDQATRSRMMAAIGRANTLPELIVRRYLHAAGLRFRVHDRRLPGTPDLVLPRFRIAVFVHGCFWHRHPGCSKTTTPSTRPDFWATKFSANVARDGRVAQELSTCGWKVMTIWECETTNEEALDQFVWEIFSSEP